MKSVWAKVPSKWVQQAGLKKFRATAAGESAAALKLYMAVAMFANFKPSPAEKIAGVAKLSFSELENICGVSRQFVARGVALLSSHGLIEVLKVGNANAYLLAGYDDLGWAKVPRAYLLDNGRFERLGIRGSLHLNALKLYLALTTFRENTSPRSLLSYDKIVEYTGMPRASVRRSIDVLINHEWISLASNSEGAGDTRPANSYILRGDFWGKQRRTYARALADAPTSAVADDFGYGEIEI